MIKKHHYQILFLAVVFLCVYRDVFASTSIGSIQAGSLSRVCKEADCSTYGNVNWKPTLNANTTGANPVVITDSGITGHIWGDEIGWINLSPAGSGISVNPQSGVISGYAYASVGSWINFSPTSVSGGSRVGVTINSSGQFSGWAYVSGYQGGWMKFDCSQPSTCVTTDWRIQSLRSSDSNTNTPSSSSGSNIPSIISWTMTPNAVVDFIADNIVQIEKGTEGYVSVGDKDNLAGNSGFIGASSTSSSTDSSKYIGRDVLNRIYRGLSFVPIIVGISLLLLLIIALISSCFFKK